MIDFFVFELKKLQVIAVHSVHLIIYRVYFFKEVF